MATEPEILSALVTTLQTITGLKAQTYPIPNMPSPCVLPLFRQALDDAWGPEVEPGPIECRLLVMARWGANGLDGAKVLADYCGYEGPKSIYRVLRESHTASGALANNVVQSVRFREIQEPRSYTMPDNSVWWGRAILLVIYTKGRTNE